MPQETQSAVFARLTAAATAATIDYATSLIKSTQDGHYVGSLLLRGYLARLAKNRESAVAALDAFCATDDITQA